MTMIRRMKFSWPISFIIGCIFYNQSQAQIAANYEIGTWYKFKTAALTYSFDDGTSNQLSVAMPMFDKYGYKMSFNVVTNWVSDWKPYSNASANGHEIASHTVSHVKLNTISATNQDPELKNSQSIINSNVTNAKCLTIIYPECNSGDVTTMSKYYISGRTCDGKINSSNITDFWNIGSYVCGNQGLNTDQAFNNQAVAAKNAKGWCVFLIHGIDGQGNFSPLSSSILSSHLTYVNANDADYWVATQLNVVKYIKERMAAKLTETTITSDSLSAVLTDGLDNSIYDADISVRRVIPTGWAGAKVYLDKKLLTSTTSTINGKTYVVFNVAPDKGTIYIVNTASTPVVSAPTVNSPVLYCQNATATALTATGTSLKWYTTATGGTASTTAPTPSTLTVGSTTYYVSQTVNSTESSRASITVTVSALSSAPVVTSPVTYEQGATAIAITAKGTNLKWYTVVNGGTASTSAPIPSTTNVGTTNYYVSQTTNTCESSRSTIAVVVTPAQTVSLVAGWNYIGCPLINATDLKTALASIWSQVVTVKNQDTFYSIDNPASVNSLSTVQWGMGYVVYVKSACTLTWK